jgi:hypothetical protein
MQSTPSVQQLTAIFTMPVFCPSNWVMLQFESMHTNHHEGWQQQGLAAAVSVRLLPLMITEFLLSLCCCPCTRLPCVCACAASPAAQGGTAPPPPDQHSHGCRNTQGAGQAARQAAGCRAGQQQGSGRGGCCSRKGGGGTTRGGDGGLAKRPDKLPGAAKSSSTADVSMPQ